MKMYIVLLSLISIISLQGMEKQLAVKAGVFACKNKRPYQEDRHFIKTEKNGNVFLGVFDGHQGKDSPDGTLVSEYLKNNLYTHFSQASGTIGQKLQAACEKANKEILNNNGIKNSGSTGIVAFVDVNNRKIFFANVGDSRGLLGRNGNVACATKDHDLTDEVEQNRIHNAGGIIIGLINPRLNKMLAMSRAFGDHNVGKGLIATPDIYEKDLNAGDTIILASDGLWDGVPSVEAIKIANEAFANKSIALEVKDSVAEGDKELSGMAKELACKSIEKRVEDNITVLVAKVIVAEKVLSSGFLPAFITNNPKSSGVIAAALIGGLGYCLEYI